MREVDVVGVRVEMPSNQPLVLLREADGGRYVPIWIGAMEATAIAYAQQGVESPRPLTHELLATVIETLGDQLVQVDVVAVHEHVFYAELLFDSGAEVSARPSDAIALALRAGVQINCADDVLDEVGIRAAPDDDAEIEKFREFLDHVDPEDFEEPNE